MFDKTLKNLTQWLFSISQYADLVGITTKGDQVKLAVSKLEKDTLTWWRQYVIYHNNNLTNLNWDTFNNKIFCAF